MNIIILVYKKRYNDDILYMFLTPIIILIILCCVQTFALYFIHQINLKRLKYSYTILIYWFLKAV
jgi:ABC-type cobalamin transport system permease subunit